MGARFFTSLTAFIFVLTAVCADKPADLPDQAKLEQQFKELLTDCVFAGHWCMLQDGKLSDEREEKYSIQGVTKSGNDVWLIYARMKYRDKEVSVPVPVQVKWAGDTAVITLNNVSIPGMGTYSARVLVFNNTYAGTWSAGDHGGMLHGIIQKKTETVKEPAN